MPNTFKELQDLEKQVKATQYIIIDTIKECIELLSTDGKNTKQIVKQKLEELVK